MKLYLLIFSAYLKSAVYFWPGFEVKIEGKKMKCFFFVMFVTVCVCVQALIHPTYFLLYDLQVAYLSIILYIQLQFHDMVQIVTCISLHSVML